MSLKPTERPRVIIHGSGYVASRLFAFCRQKRWPVVAVFNRAGAKLGHDAGRLFGLDEDVGLPVRDLDATDPEALAALRADIALNATTDFLATNYPVYARYLDCGINVLCHGVQAYNPRFENPEVATRIDRLARANGATFCGSGIWDTTRLWSGVIAAGTCLNINSVVHTALAEIGRQGAQYEAVIGVGMSVAEFERRYAATEHPLSAFLHGPPVMVLQKIGCTIADVRKRCEPIVFDQPVHSPLSGNRFSAGTVIGTRIIADVSTAEGITGRADVEYRLFKPHEIEAICWQINGMPGLSISVLRDDTANLSASSLFNRIPDVIKAPPGIVDILQMGPLSSSTLL